MAIEKKWSTRNKDLLKAAEDVYDKNASEINKKIGFETLDEGGKLNKNFDPKAAFVDEFLKKAEIMYDKAKERGAKKPSASQIAKSVQQSRTFTDYSKLAKENFIEAMSKNNQDEWRALKKQIGVRSKKELFESERFEYDKVSGQYKYKDKEGNLWFFKIEEYRKRKTDGKVTNEKHFTVQKLGG